MKQVMFKDLESEEIHGGIMTDEGDVICGCCGGLIEADELEGDDRTHEILKVFPYWVDLDEAIIGDEIETLDLVDIYGDEEKED